MGTVSQAGGAAHGPGVNSAGAAAPLSAAAESTPGAAPTALPARDAPDVETSSAAYARRFGGAAGRYLLDAQTRAVTAVLRGMPPGSALDVGGGHGQLVDPLSALGWSVTVHGTDEICGRNLRELHGKRDCAFLTADLYALPFPAGSFDLVIAVRLLSHAQDWPRLLREMCRVARRAVVVDYPSTRSLNVLTPIVFGLKKSIEGNTRTYRKFSRRELEGELQRDGFRVTGEAKQFFLPMVLHRLTHAAAPLRWAETASRCVGLTRLFGSPAILKGERRG